MDAQILPIHFKYSVAPYLISITEEHFGPFDVWVCGALLMFECVGPLAVYV